MIALSLEDRTPQKILCLGAHCDDIEIGCGGTLLQMVKTYPRAEVRWIVFCSTPERSKEARISAEEVLAGSTSVIDIRDFRDGFLPYHGAAVKDEFEKLKGEFDPTVIFTHYRDDRHQDHRLLNELTWNTYRNHLILEYEIPKYDGDFGIPNVFVPLSHDVLSKKIDIVMKHFGTQRGKHWFTRDVFESVARLRGMEAAHQGGYAEAYYCRKLVLGG